MLTATLSVVLAGALAGGFVSGLAGFGTGLVALGIWLHVVTPTLAASLVVVCSVVAQIGTIPTIWHAIDRTRVLPFIVPGLLGVPIGTRLLTYVDPDAFRLGVGIFLLGFSGFMLFGRLVPRVAWGGRLADGAIGLAGGILGGLAGLSGPLPTVWATLRGWSKDERRSVFQAFNLSILFAALVAHAVSGRLTAEFGRLMPVALPGTLTGAWLGTLAYRKLSDRRFHEIVLGLLGMSGLTLVLSSLSPGAR
ncbi:MAG: sulfite exporter TauE/SafE family protein [Acidisphaera sp.]|nr:sulfite exporter TauE/SafE family protein [Acidisphaera sp.]